MIVVSRHTGFGLPAARVTPRVGVETGCQRIWPQPRFGRETVLGAGVDEVRSRPHDSIRSQLWAVVARRRRLAGCDGRAKWHSQVVVSLGAKHKPLRLTVHHNLALGRASPAVLPATVSDASRMPAGTGTLWAARAALAACDYPCRLFIGRPSGGAGVARPGRSNRRPPACKPFDRYAEPVSSIGTCRSAGGLLQHSRRTGL
jgi:hypothetical protein